MDSCFFDFYINFSNQFVYRINYFIYCFLILIYGCYPVKYLLNIFLVLFFFSLTFIFYTTQYPEKAPDRLNTWISRIENFFNPSQSKDGNYQIERAKIAIASGGITGMGVGKSIMKNFYLKAPQTSYMLLLLKNMD